MFKVDHRLDDALRQAVEVLQTAEALVIGAGAGMGVDSGLPDFRGPEGFWRAYPPFRRLGLRFEELADPRWFANDPRLAWGFYGHRLSLYRTTAPHQGYAILRQWAARMPAGAFVVTSNVDGHFTAAGFDPDRLFEVHGSLDRLQCVSNCGAGLFSSEGVVVSVNRETMRAEGPLPRCPACGGLARPNVLMFGDFGWDPAVSRAQELRWRSWLRTVAETGRRIAIIECGAGTAVPTIRRISESLAEQLGGKLVRINVHEPEVPPGQVGLPLPAREALQRLDARQTPRSSAMLPESDRVS